MITNFDKALNELMKSRAKLESKVQTLRLLRQIFQQVLQISLKGIDMGEGFVLSCFGRVNLVAAEVERLVD